MDSAQFDALSRSLASAGTRRGLTRLLAALPLVGVLLTVLDDETARARRQRQSQGRRGLRQERPHARKKKKPPQKHKKKGKRHPAGPPPARGCVPESAARTCAGRCGQIPNNCDTLVDCGSCACGGACPVCQTCNATTGRCETNPPFVGQACGLPGQVCQDDGTCVCDDASCADGQRCNGLVCVCDATSCPTGCCDGNRTCRIAEDAACGTGGASCTRCPSCQTCIGGTCASDTRQNRTTCQLPGGGGTGVCCNGACCAGCCDARVEHGICSPCLAFVTSTTTNGNLGGLVGGDRKCQDRAEAGGFWGSYKAWLSNDVDSPSARFRCTAESCSALGYARVDGQGIASNWITLTHQNLTNPLNITELGGAIAVDTGAWTFTHQTGIPASQLNFSCQNWTVGSNLAAGFSGRPEVVDHEWSASLLDTCPTLNALYCFQQD